MAGRYTTKARVRIVLDIETGTDAWDGTTEPAYVRAFKEAKERAMTMLNNSLGRLNTRGGECPVTLVRIEDVELFVHEDKAP